MRCIRIVLLMLLATSGAPAVSAASVDSAFPASSADGAAPNWDADEARLHAQSAAGKALAVELGRLLRDDPGALALRLHALSGDNTLTWPEREAALLQFTRSLHDLPADRLPAPVIDLLSQWQPRTLIAHEETPAVGAPLFPIAATAQGLQNRWRRATAADAAAQLLDRDVDLYLDGWLEVRDPLLRAGWLDALETAARRQRSALLARSLLRLQKAPQLAPLAAQAAIGLHDQAAMAELAFQTEPLFLPPLLSALASALDDEELNGLLAELLARGDRERAALAIAVFGEVLAGNESFERRMLALLGDPALGSSAALTLSRRPSAQAKAELEARAAHAATSLPGQRARLALDRLAQTTAERTP